MKLLCVSWYLLVLAQVVIVGVHSQSECPYGGRPEFLVHDPNVVLSVDCGSNTSLLSWTPPADTTSVNTVHVYSSCINNSKVNDSIEITDTKTIAFSSTFGKQALVSSPEHLLMVDNAPVPTSSDQVCLYFGCFRRRGQFDRSTFITFATVSCTYQQDSNNNPTSSVLPSPTSSVTLSNHPQTTVNSPSIPSMSMSTSLQHSEPVKITTTSNSHPIAIIDATSNTFESIVSLTSSIAVISSTIVSADSASFTNEIISPTPTPSQSGIPSIREVSMLVMVMVPVVLSVIIVVTVVMITTLCIIFIKGESYSRQKDLLLKRPFKTEAQDKLYNIDPINVHRGLPPKALTLSQQTICENLKLCENVKSDKHFVPSYQLDTHLGPSYEDLYQMYDKILPASDSSAMVDEAIMMECTDTSEPLSEPLSSGLSNAVFPQHWQYNSSRESGDYIDMDFSSPLSPNVETYEDAWAAITTYAIEQEGLPPSKIEASLMCEASHDVAGSTSSSEVESTNDGGDACGNLVCHSLNAIPERCSDSQTTCSTCNNSTCSSGTHHYSFLTKESSV